MIHKHTISFVNAWRGLKWAIVTQPNYRIHFLLSIGAILLGFYFHISRYEFLTISILITVGLAIETINTAIEQTTDAIDTKIREDIRIAKDVSAGAMLIFALGAFMIALIIFVPKIILYFNF